MPTTIIIRINDDDHAREIMAVGAKDLALGFLPTAKIQVDRISLCYRSPDDERAAAAGALDYEESRDSWANDSSSETAERGAGAAKVERRGRQRT